MKEISLVTRKKKELVNITPQVKEAIKASKIQEGLALIFAPHASGAIVINEDEPGFKTDVEKLLGLWIPEGKNWNHDKVDDNATAHLGSAFIGQDKVVPVTNGQPKLGTWQEIFFVELDGPRDSRKVIVKVVGV